MKTLKDIATARLLNQHLLRPLFTAPQEVVSWMGAMQAQDFSMCRWAVGVRMRKPSEAGVIEALNKGDIIRSHLNRSTWQLVTKEDYHWMMPLHRERSIRSWCAFAKQSGNPISDKMMDNSRELLTNILGGKKHLTREDIIPFYQEIDIDNADSLHHLSHSKAGRMHRRTVECYLHIIALAQHISHIGAVPLQRRYLVAYFRYMKGFLGYCTVASVKAVKDKIARA